ncbi:MAG: flagella accessory protein C, partial [Haloarculaceae archaeon]
MGLLNWFGGTMDDGDEEPDEPEGGADDPFGTDDPEATTTREDGPDVVEIEHRVGELEEGLERSEGRIESVQHSQEEVAERVEGLNDTVRDLLGVYERLTSDVNPFTDAEGDGRPESFGVVNGDGVRGDLDGNDENGDVTSEHADETTVDEADTVDE